MPPVQNTWEEQEEARAIPRRTRFAPAKSAWWRPSSTVGRVFLATGAILALAAIGTAAYITRQFLIRDPHFRINGAASIQSSGLSEVNRADVLPVFGSDIGRNIFFVPLAQRRHELEAIPWVQQATVMRFLPDRLSVSIVERTPVAFVREGSKVELADADGVILTMPPAMMAQHHYSFPVVTGINSADKLEDRRARMALYLKFLAELDQNNQHLTDQISEIDLADPEDLRATMPAQGTDILAHFGDDQFLHRLQIYQSHIAEWRSRYPKLKGVDLRYNGEVPLEMDTTPPAPASASATKPAPIELPKAAPKASPAKLAAVKTSPGKSTPVKPETAAQRAAEAKKKAARRKAEKAKAAKHKPQTPAAGRQVNKQPAT
jgi:cell division protein FtsQ